MGESTWTIELAGRVDAPAAAVVEWWFHPDRRLETLERSYKTPVRDLTYERSRSGEQAIVHLRYRTDDGWDVDRVIESNLDENDVPPYVDRRFSYAARGVTTGHSSKRQFSEQCDLKIEVCAEGAEQAFVTERHVHTVTAGWVLRWAQRRVEGCAQSRRFTDDLDRCHRAIGRRGAGWVSSQQPQVRPSTWHYPDPFEDK